MNDLIFARRRYADMRGKLDMHCETDRVLHDELTRAIRALEDKIVATVSGQGTPSALPDQRAGDTPPSRESRPAQIGARRSGTG